MEDVRKRALDMERGRAADEAIDVIQNQISDRLGAINRFTPEVNKQYATLTAAFYATMAERLGTDVTTLFARHPLNIVGESVTGEGLTQALKDAPPRGWVHSTDGNDVINLWRGEDGAEAVFWTDGTGELGKNFTELSDYSLSISKSAIAHIKDRHTDEATELSRGQIPVTEKDITHIPEIVKSYDDLRFEDIEGTNNKRFAFAKKLTMGCLFISRIPVKNAMIFMAFHCGNIPQRLMYKKY